MIKQFQTLFFNPTLISFQSPRCPLSKSLGSIHHGSRACTIIPTQKMRSSWLASLLALISISLAAEDTPKARKPCTIRSPTTGLDFDLSGLSVLPPKEDGQKSNKPEKVESWMARGYDSGVNYTINICAPVVEDLEDVVGVSESLWQNVSSFYTSAGKTYSLG